MPRERSDFFRESSTKPKEQIVVLAYEGNDTERLYFAAVKICDRFNEKLIELHPLPRGKGDTNSAPNHVFKKLKSEAKDQYNFGPKDELWMIIDTDRWKNIPDIVEACKKEKNMFVAVSNPCIELWLLLHVQDISGLTAGELMQILENKKTGSRTHVERLLMTALGGSYNKSNPPVGVLIPNIDRAVQQARSCDAALEEFPTVVGSHIYKLMDKIIIPLVTGPIGPIEPTE